MNSKETKKKIAILGTENSHARIFAKMIAESEDLRLVGAFGTEPQANALFRETFGADCSATSPDAFAGEADGVLITARNGATHMEYAKPYLTPDTTVFVDKPLCNDPREAAELIALAKQNGVRLCGGSCLKYAPSLRRMRAAVEKNGATVIGASFSAPVEINSAYGGFLFYSPHLAEMALTVFGNRIRSVRAVRNGASVAAWLRYDGFCVSLFFGCDVYTASVSFSNRELHSEIGNFPYLFSHEFAVFRNLIHGKGTADAAEEADRLADHVILADAVRRAYESGGEILL